MKWKRQSNNYHSSHIDKYDIYIHTPSFLYNRYFGYFYHTLIDVGFRSLTLTNPKLQHNETNLFLKRHSKPKQTHSLVATNIQDRKVQTQMNSKGVRVRKALSCYKNSLFGPILNKNISTIGICQGNNSPQNHISENLS